MRECVRHADCPSGNCSSSRCWEHNGPFVPCNPSHNDACATGLICDSTSHYCVRPEWSPNPDNCGKNADCGRDAWCDSKKKKCIKYQIMGEECNEASLKCDKDAVCFGGHCRPKCDLSQGGEEDGCSWVHDEGVEYHGNDVPELRCKRVKKFGAFEVCLPKGLAYHRRY